MNGEALKLKVYSGIKKVLANMEGWKGNLLNPTGKEVLVNAVLQAIPIYIM